MAERTGLEPATPCVTGRYSNQLNYRSTDSFTCIFPILYPIRASAPRCAKPLLAILTVTRCHSDNSCLMPGSVLLSHGETPHYHRRYGVSLLSSAWVQVGPPRYGRQANSVSVNPHTNNACDASQPNLGTTLKISLNSKHLRCCKVKPHGSLVLVSSIHRCTYTPSLSTS